MLDHLDLEAAFGHSSGLVEEQSNHYAGYHTKYGKDYASICHDILFALFGQRDGTEYHTSGCEHYWQHDEADYPQHQ